uniref:Uncharacterized protein n=1 Tax=Oryza punctata TaxID=4537 RepID=A0A0E0JIA1_ORYPU
MSGEMDRRQSFLQLMASMHDPVDPDLFRDLVAAHNVLGDEETTTNSSSQQSHQEQEILWDPPLLDGIVLSSSENEDRVCPTNGVQMRTAMEGGTGGALAAIPVPDKLPHSETNGDCLEGSSRSANSKRKNLVISALGYSINYSPWMAMMVLCH